MLHCYLTERNKFNVLSIHFALKFPAEQGIQFHRTCRRIIMRPFTRQVADRRMKVDFRDAFGDLF